jgi:hypothetical protein
MFVESLEAIISITFLLSLFLAWFRPCSLRSSWTWHIELWSVVTISTSSSEIFSPHHQWSHATLPLFT